MLVLWHQFFLEIFGKQVSFVLILWHQFFFKVFGMQVSFVLVLCHQFFFLEVFGMQVLQVCSVQVFWYQFFLDL